MVWQRRPTVSYNIISFTILVPGRDFTDHISSHCDALDNSASHCKNIEHNSSYCDDVDFNSLQSNICDVGDYNSSLFDIVDYNASEHHSPDADEDKKESPSDAMDDQDSECDVIENVTCHKLILDIIDNQYQRDEANSVAITICDATEDDDEDDPSADDINAADVTNAHSPDCDDYKTTDESCDSKSENSSSDDSKSDESNDDVTFSDTLLKDQSIELSKQSDTDSESSQPRFDSLSPNEEKERSPVIPRYSKANKNASATQSKTVLTRNRSSDSFSLSSRDQSNKLILPWHNCRKITARF